MHVGPFLYNSNHKHIKALGLSLSWVLHLGRGIAPSMMELQEVGWFDKRAIEN